MTRRAPAPDVVRIVRAHADLLSQLPNLVGRDPQSCCWACGDGMRDLEKAHIDASSAGGSDTDPANFLLLCPRCHREHPDTAPRDYQLRWLRERESFAEYADRLFKEDGQAVERSAEAFGERVYAWMWLKEIGDAGLARILRSIPMAAGFDSNVHANRRAALVQSFEGWMAVRLGEARAAKKELQDAKRERARE